MASKPRALSKTNLSALVVAILGVLTSNFDEFSQFFAGREETIFYALSFLMVALREKTGVPVSGFFKSHESMPDED